MIKYTSQLKHANYDITKKRSHHNKAKNKIFCNDIFCFDIEVTSSFIDENGNVIQYYKGRSSEYWNSLTPVSLCYIWQFSFNDIVYYGRELRDFINVLNDIPTEMNVIIWVHNLSYEFCFLSNLFEWESIFARSAHKVMKCTPKGYKNIEFRCTYFLTRLSLASWGDSIGIAKKVGDLDYNIMRTPLTPMSNKELGYSEYDVLIMYYGILEYKNRYGTLYNIPLTQTGTVRREVKELLMSDPEYVKFIKKLVPENCNEYRMLQLLFAGGYTHANRMYSGFPITDTYIEHYDFASSYPYVMVSEKFPMSKWTYVFTDKVPDMSTFGEWAYILKLTFYNIRSTACNTYIQASKISAESYVNHRYDNGRLISADKITILITEQDFITIKNNYKWVKLEVEFVYKSKKDYLPLKFVNYILDLYGNKTSLKDVEGKEDIYMQSKQYINSLFGMMVTAIIQSSVYLVGDEWKTEMLTEEIVDKRLKDLRSYNPREKRYFLSYSWGIWVTSCSRRNLAECIEHVDNNSLYSDTDSLFALGENDFTFYNKKVVEKLKKVSQERGIDFERFQPKSPDGKKHLIGIFEKEKDCSEFCTLGAKRYVERRIDDNKLHLTVSGINKGAVECLENDITNFKDGFNFDKDSPHTKKMHHTYIYNQPKIKYPDGYVSTYKYGVNMRDDGYKLSINDDYKEVISYMEITTDNIPEEFLNGLRGVF